MSPLKFDIPIRKRGFKNPEEVEEFEKEIVSLFKDEKDTKTFTELLKLAKKKGWSKSSVWRYVEKMVKKRKLIKEGEGKGASYRCNLVELMQLDHLAYLDKIRELCSKEGLSSFYEMGAVNCTMLGIPSEGLTEYEQSVAKAITEKLASSWLLLFGLRGIISLRLSHKDKEIRDLYTMLSLYEHEFHKTLSYILEQPKITLSPEMVKDLFTYLRKRVISWAKKNEIPSRSQSFDSLMKQYDLEKAARGRDYPPFKFKDENLKLYPEELLALTITGHMMDSKEFSQRIENWLKFYLLDFFETARQFNFNKAQEIAEAVLEIFKTVSMRRLSEPPSILRTEEKERLLNWNMLLNRYGEENTKFILDLVEEATLMDSSEYDVTSVQKVIAKKTASYLKKKGIMDSYAKEKFWE